MIRLLMLIAPLLLAAPGEPAGRKGKPVREQPRVGDALPKTSAGPLAARPPAKRPGMMMAAAALNSGSPLAAIRMYKVQVADNPNSPAPNVALGRAYAKAGRCRDALDYLWPWIDTTPFGSRAALAAASCSTRLGLYGDAVYFDMIALAERPNNIRALSNLASDLYLVGDPISAAEVLERLAYGLSGDDDRSIFAQAANAVRMGDTDEFDTLVALTDREGRSTDELRRMSAQLWLDLGDPVAAISAFASTNRPAQRIIRAEANRRMGFFDEADSTINARIRGRTESISSDAVRARIKTDLGEFDKARALLDEWSGAEHPDLVASEWYLARAQGDAAAMKAWEAEYALLETSRIRTLASLIPIPSAP